MCWLLQTTLHLRDAVSAEGLGSYDWDSSALHQSRRRLRHVTQRSNRINAACLWLQRHSAGSHTFCLLSQILYFHRSEYLCIAISLECQAVWGCHTLNILAKKSPLSSFTGPKRRSGAGQSCGRDRHTSGRVTVYVVNEFTENKNWELLRDTEKTSNSDISISMSTETSHLE